MNPDLDRLRPYPFERLAALLSGVEAPQDRKLLRLSIGEPQHAPPPAVLTALADSLDLLASYPTTRGGALMRESQARWLTRRHGLTGINAETQLMPVNGSREALFAIAQTHVGRGSLVGCPNPFYQIYEGAALLAGATPVYIDTTVDNDFLPDPEALTEAQWEALDLLYLCNPGNPTGAVMAMPLLQRFIEKALRYDVLLVSDECYSELYLAESRPPVGLLAACESMGNDSYRNCLSMHSLSKRSNLPGLRSGFAAGDAQIIARFLRYRSYHGCAMPPHHQQASIVAWDDEQHVLENRARYREKFDYAAQRLKPLLDFPVPEGAFYLWPLTPMDDEEFARELYRQQGVVVLPGTYLGRENDGRNPGSHRVRMALVADEADCAEAIDRIAEFLGTT